ncbi:RYamide receptor-like [Montipora foliosa]|uniref:RYamide receptor-like n=1 Tax=Montipora foliosa TaxID=591990 RepID=UPI0035F11F49
MNMSIANDSTNSTDLLYSLSHSPSTTHQVILILTYSLMFLLSLSGNTMTVCVVASRPYMRSITNRLIANMAVADLIMTLSAMPYSVAFMYVKTRWFGGILGIITCKLLHFSIALSVAASVLTLVVIALDRFFAVVFPFKRSRVIPKITKTTTIIWVLSVLSTSPYLYFFKSLQEPNDNYYCFMGETFANTAKARRALFLFIFIFLYAAPLCIVATFYSLISFKLWFRQIPGNPTAANRRNAELSKRRTIKMLMVIVIVFALCWLPSHLMHFFTFFDKETYDKIPLFWFLFAYGVSHANSAINPYLYIALNTKFRRAFLELVKSCFSPAGNFLRSQFSNTMSKTPAVQATSLERDPSRVGRRREYDLSRSDTSEDNHRMRQVNLVGVKKTAEIKRDDFPMM